MYGPVLLLLVIFWSGVLGQGPLSKAFPAE